ncbi:hypothetical protein KAI52_04040 [Candidatus Parcubacteria bacterium]|nr:hypothetical protein [Candidatus Parcubacteria bacterium]
MLDATQAWQIAIITSIQNLWIRMIEFIPNLFGAVIIFVIGLMVAISLEMLAIRILKKMKIEKASEEIGLTDFLERGDIKMNIPRLVGGAVKWFIIIASLMAVADILNLPQITGFLNSIIAYIPNIIAAVVIMAISIIVANFLSRIVSKGTKTTKVAHNKMLANLSKWAVLIFGLMAALVQLGVASSLITILFTGVVASLSLALGLAFGLGGTEKAMEILNKKCCGKK